MGTLARVMDTGVDSKAADSGSGRRNLPPDDNHSTY